MKRVALVLSAFVLAVGLDQIRADDLAPAPMPPRPVGDVADNFAAEDPIHIKVRFCESDSAADREKGNVKVISQPRAVTLANRSFSIHTGGEKLVIDHAAGDVDLIEIGQRVEGKVGAVAGGTLRISVSFSHTAVEDEDVDGVVLQTESKRILKTVVLGETTRLSLIPRGEKGKVVWVELTFDQDG